MVTNVIYRIFNHPLLFILGDCTLINGNIELSCGHKHLNAKCYETRDIESIRCREKVLKTLPKCGHQLEVMVCTLLNILLVINNTDIYDKKSFMYQ